TGACVLVGELRQRVLRLRRIVRAHRRRHCVVQHGGVRCLLLRPPAPALHGDDADRQRDDDACNGISPLLPPCLEVLDLVLFFEIVSGHRQSLCYRVESARPRSLKGTIFCSPGSRSGFTLTASAAASSAPISSA